MRIYFLLVFLCCVLNTNGEEKFTISGYITDKNNGETIIGANVFCADLKAGVTTNTYGFYSLTLPEGNYEISFSFIGYQTDGIFQSQDEIDNAKVLQPGAEIGDLRFIDQDGDGEINFSNTSWR